MSSKPTIVIVHGAWHSPSHFDPVTKYLQSHGYTVEVPHLPSVHADDITKITLTEDIAVVRKSILEALKSSNVVVMAHSYGTIPSSGAFEGLDTPSRTSAGHSTSVTGFMIIAGLLIPSGTSVVGFFGATPAPAQDVRGPIVLPKDPPGPGYLLYHDVPFDEAVKCIKTLKPQAWAVCTRDLPYAGHLVVPTRYLICEKDNILPEFVQKTMVDKAREGLKEGGKFEADTIESSHSPFLSRTEEVGKWVRKYGGGEQGVEADAFGSY